MNEMLKTRLTVKHKKCTNPSNNMLRDALSFRSNVPVRGNKINLIFRKIKKYHLLLHDISLPLCSICKQSHFQGSATDYKTKSMGSWTLLLKNTKKKNTIH